MLRDRLKIMLVKVCFQMFFSWKGYLPYFPQVSLFLS